jgi:hypothetical protein
MLKPVDMGCFFSKIVGYRDELGKPISVISGSGKLAQVYQPEVIGDLVWP